MDAIWQFLGVVALVAVGWLQVTSWRKGREIDALKRAEAERKAAEAAMVAEATRRLQAARDALDKAQEISGDDSDFYFCLAREAIRDQVRKQINRFRLTPEQALVVDKQIVLPGFERLQRAYLIEINGDQIAIPIEKMTDAQLQTKITELEAMGDGCYQHATELKRYRDEHPAPPNHEAAA